MKLLVVAVAVAVLVLIAGTIWFAAGVREETVVSNPYEEGLKVGHGHLDAPQSSVPSPPQSTIPSPPAPAGGEGQGEGGRGSAPACDLGSTACARALPGGGTVRVELAPRPLATMKELAVLVDVDLGPGAPRDASVSVSFSMPGMAMGENRSRLAHTGPGRFEGKAVLVRCPSGRREWTADVEVAAPGAPVRSAKFSAAVAE